MRSNTGQAGLDFGRPRACGDTDREAWRHQHPLLSGGGFAAPGKRPRKTAPGRIEDVVPPLDILLSRGGKDETGLVQQVPIGGESLRADSIARIRGIEEIILIPSPAKPKGRGL